jgi:hypothetical protein
MRQHAPARLPDGEAPQETVDAAASGVPPRDVGPPRENDAVPAEDLNQSPPDAMTAGGTADAIIVNGPAVDRGSPQLYAVTFKANVADPAATKVTG